MACPPHRIPPLRVDYPPGRGLSPNRETRFGLLVKAVFQAGVSGGLVQLAAGKQAEDGNHVCGHLIMSPLSTY